ncbi:hypothetical protein BH10ACI4_BH10ACI4_03810 [soil metagenome]
MKHFYLNSYTPAPTAITLVFHHLYHAWFQTVQNEGVDSRQAHLMLVSLDRSQADKSVTAICWEQSSKWRSSFKR